MEGERGEKEGEKTAFVRTHDTETGRKVLPEKGVLWRWNGGRAGSSQTPAPWTLWNMLGNSYYCLKTD